MERESRVAVGLALYGFVPAYVYFRHIQWFITCSVQTREIAGIQVAENCYIPWARNNIVRDSLKENYTHIFMLDQDVIVPPGTIKRLLEHRKPIVGALYYQKIKGHAPVAGNFSDVPDVGWEPMEVKAPLQKVNMVGMGATLIDCDVLRKMGDDGWFDMSLKEGEDIFFCKKAQELGYQIWVDTTIDTFHVGATPISKVYKGVGG